MHLDYVELGVVAGSHLEQAVVAVGFAIRTTDWSVERVADRWAPYEKVLCNC